MTEKYRIIFLDALSALSTDDKQYVTGARLRRFISEKYGMTEDEAFRIVVETSRRLVFQKLIIQKKRSYTFRSRQTAKQREKRKYVKKEKTQKKDPEPNVAVTSSDQIANTVNGGN